jgi:integrase
VLVESAEFRTLLDHLNIREQAITSLLYGSGLTLTEALRIRVLDLDVGTRVVAVRNERSRVTHRTPLDPGLLGPVLRWLRFRARIYERDAWWWTETGAPSPFEGPFAERWQRERVFVSAVRGRKPRRNSRMLREGLSARMVQRHILEAVCATDVNPDITPAAFRASYAVAALRAGVPREILAERMGLRPRSLYHYERLLGPFGVR